MKRLLLLALCCLLLTACGREPTPAVTTAPTQPAAVPTAPTSAPPTAPEPPTTQATEPTAPTVTFTLYTPNDNADGFLTETVSAPLLPGEVLSLLIDAGVLRGTVMVNSYELREDRLYLDLTEGFLRQLRSYGTAGEYMMLGSTVNSLLSAFQCESVYITVDGQIMETGHVVYDYPIGFME